MLLIGLTGGIGMGKSACAQLLHVRGVPAVDTDDLARQVVEPGQPALGEIQQTFGSKLIGPDGRLRRDELARVVFADHAARKRLENILHPRIRKLWLAQAQTWRVEKRARAVVIIPLLFETSAEAELDVTLCVACSASTQHDRLAARGWSAGQIEQRIRAQWCAEQKMLLANFVIWTEASMEVHAAQLERILSGLPQGN